MADYETIQVQQQNQVITIILDEPATRNAFSARLRAELLDAISLAEQQQEARVIVLGSSSDAFCSGHNLGEPPADPQGPEQELLKEYLPLFSALRGSAKPVIAAVPGVVAGIGCALMLSCDLVVMADNARFFAAFSRLGLVPDGGFSWHMMRALGRQRAFEFIAEGASLSAEECLTYGLANKLASAETVLPSAQSWAVELAQGAPIALAGVKEILGRAQNGSWEEVFRLEASWQNRCYQSDDVKEGVTAFFEKRPPRFTGH